MADSTIKPDTGNDLVLQNNGGTKKIEITNSGNIEVTGSMDLNGNELILDADGDTSITADTDDRIDFRTAGSDRVHIDSSGRVGIDVTPIEWANFTGVLQIGSTGAIVNNGHTQAFSENCYYDGTWKYLTTDKASKYYQSGGYHYFEIASSGTSGSSITFTPALTIDLNQDIYSTAFTTRTWNLGGFVGGTTTVHTGGYKRIGKMVFIQGYVEGTSDVNTFTITNMPYAAKTNYHFSIAIGLAEDNSTACDANASVYGSTLTFRKSSLYNGWTASGTKKAMFTGWYEAESI